MFVEVTVKSTEYNTYRVEVDDDFDVDGDWDELEDCEESPLVRNKVVATEITEVTPV